LRSEHVGLETLAKRLLNALAALLVLLPVAFYRLSCMTVGEGRTFPGWSQLFSLLPGRTGVYLRRAFYRWVLRRCALDSWIEFGTTISHPSAEIGRRVYVGSFCCLGDVTLDDDVLVSSHVSIMNGNRQHGIERLDVPVREQPGEWPRVTIGKDSWLGERSIIQADVGDHCVVAAGAVVTSSLPDYAIAMGVPARIKAYRRDPQRMPASDEPDIRKPETPSAQPPEARPT
jgi:acetyltransferase-like isoleucine patch superfamily enzyme